MDSLKLNWKKVGGDSVKLDYGHLPVITDDILETYHTNTDGFIEPVGTYFGWTQDAVDFACLVTGNLSDRIKELEGQLAEIEADVKCNISNFSHGCGERYGLEWALSAIKSIRDK